jgi:hypothetical protein
MPRWSTRPRSGRTSCAIDAPALEAEVDVRNVEGAPDHFASSRAACPSVTLPPARALLAPTPRQS